MGREPSDTMGYMDEEWKHGLCGCCDSGCVQCCCNYGYCGTCNLGRAAEISQMGNCFVVCCFHCCCQPVVRCKLVQIYNLDESSFMSCLLACCCAGCSAAQIIQEVEHQSGFTSTCCGCGQWVPGAGAAAQAMRENAGTQAQQAPGQAPGQASSQA